MDWLLKSLFSALLTYYIRTRPWNFSVILLQVSKDRDQLVQDRTTPGPRQKFGIQDLTGPEKCMCDSAQDQVHLKKPGPSQTDLLKTSSTTLSPAGGLHLIRQEKTLQLDFYLTNLKLIRKMLKIHLGISFLKAKTIKQKKTRIHFFTACRSSYSISKINKFHFK